MRIGFDAKRLFNNTTGLGNYSRFVLDGLLKHNPQDEYILYTPKVLDQLEQKFANQLNTTIVRPSNLIYKKLHTLWRSYEIDALAQKNQLDIYHGLSNELPIGIEKTGIKTVVTIHDLIFKYFSEGYTRTDKIIYDRKFESACSRADKIIATSIQTQKDIIKYYGIDHSKIEVVYQDCDEIFSENKDVEMFNLVIKNYHLPEHFLLMVSKTEKRKNHLTLLQAFEKTHKDIPFSLVLIGGEGEEEKNVMAYIKEKKLPVIRLKNIPHQVLPYIYDASFATIYPSKFEGFGIPLVESLRRKKPVITNITGCFKEVSGTAALYTDVLNPEAIAEAIIQLVSDKNIYEQLVSNCTHELLKFDSKKLTQDLVNIYHSLLT